MINQTNTDSGAIAQGQNSTSAGQRGVAVGGNMENSTNVSGNDNTIAERDIINNIIIVGQFLELARVEGLLPKIEDRADFSNITEAVEDVLKLQSSEDLLEAIVFVGKVMGDLIDETTLIKPSAPMDIRSLVEIIPNHIFKNLKALGYWGIYSQRYSQGSWPKYSNSSRKSVI